MEGLEGSFGPTESLQKRHHRFLKQISAEKNPVGKYS